MIREANAGAQPRGPLSPATAQLPEPGLALDRSRQDRVPDVVNGGQAPRRGTAPLESSRGRRPLKQRHMPRVVDTAALVIDEAVMIGRAPRRDQPTNRQLGIDDHIGHLKLGSGLGDVECLAAEQPLQPVADAERQSSDGRDNPEPLVLHVGPQGPGHRPGVRRLAPGSHGRPEAHTDRAEKLCPTHPDLPELGSEGRCHCRRHGATTIRASTVARLM
jgi:hypothetical protein